MFGVPNEPMTVSPNVFVQECERARAEDHLVVAVDRVPREDRRGDGRVVIRQEGGDGLAVDLDREIVVAGPGRDVMVTVQRSQGLRGDDIF